MKRTGYIPIILLFSICCSCYGQSGYDSTRITLGYPVYSQYLQNGLMINPAYAGSREALSVALSRRDQWLGISNGPVLTTLSLHSPLKNDKVALGLIAEFMDYGVTSSQSVYAIYAYHIKLAKGKISFGLKTGFDRSTTDYSILKGIQIGDPVFEDNAKPYLLPNVGAGVYYFSNRFFGGLSVPSFLFYKNIGSGKTQAYHSFSEYDLMFTAGGLISFSQDFRFKPSVLLDYSLRNSSHINQLDINGNFIISDVLWIGGSYRTTEQVAVGILQVQVTPQLMFGLSYDYPAGRMTTYSKGSGEIFLRYEFGSKISAANPRYF
ncbi:MAG: type IX secretion system membrane protein PorP/SprF [Bacteroidales bacterium]